MKNLKIRDSVQHKETGREFNNKNKKKQMEGLRVMSYGFLAWRHYPILTVTATKQ